MWSMPPRAQHTASFNAATLASAAAVALAAAAVSPITTTIALAAAVALAAAALALATAAVHGHLVRFQLRSYCGWHVPQLPHRRARLRVDL